MKHEDIVSVVCLLILLFPVNAESASKDPVLPNVQIVNPQSGQTVEGIVKVMVNAEGVGLKNLYLTIQGEQEGTEVLMEDCVHSKEKDGKLEKMSCTYKWDTISFAGEKVKLTADIKDNTGHDSDEVAVRVSGDAYRTGNSFWF